MKSYLIPVLFAFLLLIGCSGEGYIEVINSTPGPIVFSLNNELDETLLSGDTSNTYTISVVKGNVNTVPITATGDWLNNYSANISIADGGSISHRINSQVIISYYRINNATDYSVYLTIGDEEGIILLTAGSSNTYSVMSAIGESTEIQIEITGTWVNNLENYTLLEGDTIDIDIESNLAGITLVNTSVDSMSCLVEDNDIEYFTGNDSITNTFVVDGYVEVASVGRYKFLLNESMPWSPVQTYRYELTPDACEIQLNNLHANRAIYYVFISLSTADSWGDDQLGDDILNPQEGYVWKAAGDVTWDIRVEAGDTHPDSALYAYEFYDTEPSASDITWIYEFPTIFTPVTASSSSKITGPTNNMMKPGSLNKVSDHVLQPSRIEKIRKVDAGKGGLKALRK